MNKYKTPLINKEISQLIWGLLFIVVVCPMILVALFANDIPVPDPRIIFWFSAVAGLALLYLANLITLFLHIILKEQSFERLFGLTKKIRSLEPCFLFVKNCNDKRLNEKAILLGLIVIFIFLFGISIAITFKIITNPAQPFNQEDGNNSAISENVSTQRILHVAAAYHYR